MPSTSSTLIYRVSEEANENEPNNNLNRNHYRLFLFTKITCHSTTSSPPADKLTRNLNKEKLKLSDWLNNKYSPGSTYNGTWISDTELAFINAEGSFVRYDVRQNETRIIVDAGVMVRRRGGEGGGEKL